MEAFNKGKVLYCARVESPEVFNFTSALDVFRSIYGSQVVIMFVCV